MRNFTYQALTKDEELRAGVIAAQSAAAALAELESQGLTVLLIRQVDAQDAVPEPAIELAVVPAGEGERILRERVNQLIERRATLAPALTAFAEELPKGRARRDLQRLATRLNDGASAAELTKTPDLANVWLPLIGSGSTIGAGHLQDVFAEAERDYVNRAQMRRSLAYPMGIVFLALFVLVFLGIFVVPTFVNIFDDFELELPRLSLLIVNFSKMLNHQPLELVSMISIFLGAGYLAIQLIKRWLLPGRWLGEFLNGNSQQLSEMAAFVRRLAEALNAGLPLPDALQLVGSNSSHRWLRRECLELASALASDPPNSERIKQSSLPATVVYALHGGPQGTPHVQLLQTLADTYFERLGNRFSWATGFLPHFAILLIGFVVFIVVSALFVPLVELINGLTG